jgi:hypothetical protein
LFRATITQQSSKKIESNNFVETKPQRQPRVTVGEGSGHEPGRYDKTLKEEPATTGFGALSSLTSSSATMNDMQSYVRVASNCGDQGYHSGTVPTTLVASPPQAPDPLVSTPASAVRPRQMTRTEPPARTTRNKFFEKYLQKDKTSDLERSFEDYCTRAQKNTGKTVSQLIRGLNPRITKEYMRYNGKHLPKGRGPPWWPPKVTYSRPRDLVVKGTTMSLPPIATTNLKPRYLYCRSKPFDALSTQGYQRSQLATTFVGFYTSEL